MQKTNIKASILIWSIFLSMIISITFISISFEINKNIKDNYSIQKEIKNNYEIKNILNSGSLNKNFKEKYILKSGEILIFEELSSKKIGLKNNQIHNAKINNDSTINISILDGSPIFYNINSLSGIVESSISINTTPGILEIQNLGGYSYIEIKSDLNTSFLSEDLNYKIIKKIGNKEVIKSKGKIKIF